MQIRPCEIADIPSVVRLRARCFGGSSQATPRLVEARFRKVLFDNPWYREDLSSLVAEDWNGSIVGFLGVVPRPMSFNGNPVWMAVSTQLMADKENGALAGVTLLQRFFEGPQDLSFADLANEPAMRIWSSLGEPVANLYSLYWIRPLRPARFTRQSWRLPGLVFRPVEALGDLYLTRRRQGPFGLPPSDCSTADIDAERLCALHDRFLGRHACRPVYSEAALGWLLADLSDELPSGEVLRKKEVADAKGRPLGWYLYCLGKSGAAQVIQLGGRPDGIGKVLDSLCRDAYSDGAVYVTGRIQPEYLAAFSDPAIHLSRRGPWVCIGSRRGDLKRTVLEGDAWLTRLEGEWWMNF